MTAPLDVRVELLYDDAWNDITLDVRQTSDIKHTWGRSNESSDAAPRSIELVLNNGVSHVTPTVSGRYSPRNPRSDLYGKIGRNTPIRVRLGARRNEALSLPGAEQAYMSTPDTSALDITGDFDARLDITPATWRPAGIFAYARKYVSTDDQRSWAWWMFDGELRFRWSPDGTLGNANTAISTVAVPEDSERLAIRVTLDVDNGAGGRTTTFYTAPTIAGPWTQLGAAVVNATSTTSIHSGTADVELGQMDRNQASGITSDPFEGLVHAFELRNGIDGTVVANPVFSGHEPGTTSFTDAAGRPWTLNGSGGHFPDPSVRYGEVTQWPLEWELSGSDVWVPITAKSILRRLNQGAAPLRSSLFRDLSTKAEVVAYWPLEEGKDAGHFSSGLPNDTSQLRATNAEVKAASFSDFDASESIPTFGEGFVRGNVPRYAGAANQRVIFLVHVPEGGVTADRALALFRTEGRVVRWDIVVSPTGGLKVRGFDDDLALVFDSGFTPFGINGQLLMMSLWLEQAGTAVNWQLFTHEVGAAAGLFSAGTAASTTYDRFRTIQLGTTPGLSDTALGHVAIINDDVHSIWDVIQNSLIAWSGETALERVIRLCTEEGVPLYATGSTDSAPVGSQGAAALLELLGEAAKADMAIFGDAVDGGALRWRGRSGLYNQDVALTLDYAAGEVSPPFSPVPDDQATRNDINVKRTNGSSLRVVQETGPLNVQLPADDPEGVGRYQTSPEFNLANDDQLEGQAHWRLHLGTVDEDRFPSVVVDLGVNPSKSDAATAVESGSRVQVVNPPDWMPPETVDQLAQGGTETLAPYRHLISYGCSPASPWTVGVVSDGTDEQRADTSGSETTAAFVAGTGTSLSVAAKRGHEDFENGDLTFPFGQGGSTLPWARTSTQAQTGAWSLKSGAITHNQTSDAVVAVPTNARTVQFWYRVSSEATFDFFRFLIDGVEQFTASGTVGWTQSAEFDVSAASTITFRYTKDGSVSSGEDAAYIDNVIFPGVETNRGPLWTIDAGELPFEVKASGVVLNVTAISGIASPQTFTVDVVPVNGVTKPIPAGSDVRLAQPAVVAL